MKLFLNHFTVDCVLASNTLTRDLKGTGICIDCSNRMRSALSQTPSGSFFSNLGFTNGQNLGISVCCYLERKDGVCLVDFYCLLMKY